MFESFKMSHHSHSRSYLTFGSSRKRKEREALYPLKDKASINKGDESVDYSNQLLAGYMAYEYLSKGTLMGQKLEAEESKRGKPETARKKEQKSYDEVASILKTEGAHIPGVVNPTQLSRWINM